MRERIRKLEKKLIKNKEDMNIIIRIHTITRPSERKPGIDYVREYDPKFPSLELYRTKDPVKVIKIAPGT